MSGRLAAIERAHTMVARLCLPRFDPQHRAWLMSIPARPDHDPDLVIAAGLDAGEAAVRENAALLAERDALRERLAALVADAAHFAALHHQFCHGERAGDWRECGRGVCPGVARAIARAEGAS